MITTPESLSTDCREALSDLLRLPVEQVMAAWNVSQTDRGYDWNLYGSRVVHVPQPLLGDVQRQILDRFLRTGPISPAAYSGVPGRSYVMAAMKHLGGPAAETAALDLADAFGSATYRHARAALSKRLSHELWILGLTGPESTAVVAGRGARGAGGRRQSHPAVASGFSIERGDVQSDPVAVGRRDPQMVRRTRNHLHPLRRRYGFFVPRWPAG